MTRLTLKTPPPVRIEIDQVIQAALSGVRAAEIGRMALIVGNRVELIGDWFAVEAGEAGQVLLSGETARLDRIGAGMTRGVVVVEGDGGAYLGEGMSGGLLTVHGSAGPCLGAAMTGGRIDVAGDAGDFIGCALPGERKGMAGGTIVIAGRAGDRVGDRMARGLIAIGGDAGSGAASRMIAGTIIVGGRLGGDAGVAMKRGSVLALGGVQSVLPSFGDSGPQDLVVFRLWRRHLAAIGLGHLAPALADLRRFVGDSAIGGTGEILVPVG